MVEKKKYKKKRKEKEKGRGYRKTKHPKRDSKKGSYRTTRMHPSPIRHENVLP
jgi:hypothetical protein